jgi:hypothetical protein
MFLGYNYRIMLKSLTMFAVFLTVTQTAAPVPRQAPDSRAQASSNATQESNTNQPPPASPSAVVHPPDALKQQLGSDGKDHGTQQPQTVFVRELPSVSVSKDWEDWILWGAQIALAVVGGFGIRYAYRTLQIIGRQTKAAEDSAKAALLSAQTLADSERGWVTEKIKFTDKLPRQNTGSAGVLVVAFTFKNIGRQPVFIRNIQTRFHVAEGQLPDTPMYSVASLIPPAEIGAHGKLMAPDEEIHLGAILEQVTLRDDQIAEIEENRLLLFAYALVTYEVFGVKRITQCGYKWHTLRGLTFEGDKSGFRRGCPDSYNRST